MDGSVSGHAWGEELTVEQTEGFWAGAIALAAAPVAIAAGIAKGSYDAVSGGGAFDEGFHAAADPVIATARKFGTDHKDTITKGRASVAPRPPSVPASSARPSRWSCGGSRSASRVQRKSAAAGYPAHRVNFAAATPGRTSPGGEGRGQVVQGLGGGQGGVDRQQPGLVLAGQYRVDVPDRPR